MAKLTIGMCVYDDYDGLFFTLQSIRMHHKEVIDDIEFVIVNNNPDSEQGELTKNFILNQLQHVYKYTEFTQYTGTSIRNQIFELAETPYVLVTDCHVLFELGSLKKLIDFYDAGLDDGNLLQGPLLYDCLTNVSTHFDKTWSGGMQGMWGLDERYVNQNSAPFEIEGQGLGVFSCRKDSWLGFNSGFRGFGGEEIYIHEKYKLKGKKTICLPFLRWNHRFERVSTPYPNTYTDRYYNYILGRIELEQDFDDVEEHFSTLLTSEEREAVLNRVIEFYEKVNEPVPCNCGK